MVLPVFLPLSLLSSERYMIALSQHCLPRDPEKINQCFAIFTDLDSNDLNNKDLYIACHIIRIGGPPLTLYHWLSLLTLCPHSFLTLCPHSFLTLCPRLPA